MDQKVMKMQLWLVGTEMQFLILFSLIKMSAKAELYSSW